MSKAKENKAVIENFEEATPVVTPVENPVETPIEKRVVYIGKIRDCEKLNVREKPDINSKVLCKLDKNSEVEIEKSESTKEFYKVCTSSGINGYCMKKYIYVKKQEV